MNFFLKNAYILLILIFLLGSGAHAENSIFLKYPKLFDGLKSLKPGDIVKLKNIGIAIETTENHKGKAAGIYYILYPRDIDIKSTHKQPYNKIYPYLHLNLPLLPDSSPTSFLVISDQPESIIEDGLYAKSTVPAGKRVRFLIDHFNKSRQTKWVKVFLTAAEDSVLMIHKKGSSIEDNSVAAGTVADKISHQISLADHRDLQENIPYLLEQFGPVKPGETLVAWYEMTPGKDMCIRTVVTDKDKLTAPGEEDFASLPKLKSLKWSDNEERLKELVDSLLYPSRYYRVLDSFIHARGIFPYPDRYCKAVYDYIKNPAWVQVYSAFEYIEGLDELTADDNPVQTNNRGNYGSYVRMNIAFKSLPWGVDKVAVIAVNNSDSMGGMFKTTLDNTTGTFFIFDKTSDIIRADKGVLLWKGRVKKGETIDIEFFALANTSVRIWYLIIPVKD